MTDVVSALGLSAAIRGFSMVEIPLRRRGFGHSILYNTQSVRQTKPPLPILSKLLVATVVIIAIIIPTLFWYQVWFGLSAG